MIVLRLHLRIRETTPSCSPFFPPLSASVVLTNGFDQIDRNREYFSLWVIFPATLLKQCFFLFKTQLRRTNIFLLHFISNKRGLKEPTTLPKKQ